MKSITFLLDEGGYENTVRGRKTSGSDGKGQSLWKLSGPTAPITATIIHSRIRLLVVLSCYICNNTVFLPVPADLITHKSTHCVHNKTKTRTWEDALCCLSHCPFVLLTRLSCVPSPAGPTYLLNHEGVFSSLFDAVVFQLSWFTLLPQRAVEATRGGSVALPKVLLPLTCICLHIRATYSTVDTMF